MQLRQSQLKEGRPICPSDSNHRVHAHGRYERNKTPDDVETFEVPRFICTQCGLTFSVLPDDVVPYRPISTQLLESGLDCAFLDKDPPPLTENEKGCLKRACQSFIQNIPFLTDTLGQIIKTTHPSAAQLWQELRELSGTMSEILLYLAALFKVSLLGMYRCLTFRCAN